MCRTIWPCSVGAAGRCSIASGQCGIELALRTVRSAASLGNTASSRGAALVSYAASGCDRSDDLSQFIW